MVRILCSGCIKIRTDAVKSRYVSEGHPSFDSKEQFIVHKSIKDQNNQQMKPTTQQSLLTSVHLLSANNILYTQSRNVHAQQLTSHHRFQQLRK